MGFFIGLGAIASVQADVDDASYDAASQRLSTSKRRAMEAYFEQERKREEEREHQAREAAARLEAERQALLAARPYPVRLVEQRCTECHDASRYRQQSHTWPGWLLVVLRMKYLNDAHIESGELSIIASHLAAEHPAEGTDALLEYATLPIAAGLGGVGFWLVWRRRKKG